MSVHGANPIFFNKKNKDWTSRTLANQPPHPPTSDSLTHPPPPPLLKLDVICVSPLTLTLVKVKLQDKIVTLKEESTLTTRLIIASRKKDHRWICKST